MDTLARALLVAADMVETGTLSSMVEARYAGWSEPLGTSILAGEVSLAFARLETSLDIAADAFDANVDGEHGLESGRQREERNQGQGRQNE